MLRFLDRKELLRIFATDGDIFQSYHQSYFKLQYFHAATISPIQTNKTERISLEKKPAYIKIISQKKFNAVYLMIS